MKLSARPGKLKERRRFALTLTRTRLCDTVRCVKQNENEPFTDKDGRKNSLMRFQLMSKTTTHLSILLLIALFCWACAGRAASSNDATTTIQSPTNAAAELQYKVPDGWVTEHPSSTMRAAQYDLPKATGDPEDASLVLYFFGAGQGGSVAANIDRWVGQMEQPGGGLSKDKAKTETITVNGLKVTLVDVSGTYTAQMSPGSDTRHNNTSYRLRAAVVETPKGNYFAKLVGPEKTVSRWDQSFMDYVKSFEFK